MIRVGVNYEGRDPRFVETVLPLAEIVEVTPDAIATLRDGVPFIPDDAIRELAAIGRNTPITLHGVGLSIASADAMNAAYLALTDTLMQSVDVAWHSEHLGYVMVDGEHLGTMLVPPRTEEALELVCARVEAIRARYAKPFLLEHVVNLFPDPGGDYTAAGFLNEIVRRTGCGLLLDIYNLECDAHNGICSTEAFLGELDLDAVREIHVACGIVDRGVRVDVHSRVTRDETLALLQNVLAMAPNVEAVIFEILGPAVPSVGVDAIAAELQRVRAAVHGARRADVSSAPKADGTSALQSALSLREHQRAMRDLIRRGVVADDPYIASAAKSVGLEVTRDTIRGWLRFRLDRNCRLTSAILRRRGTYEPVFASVERAAVSPFIEELSNNFLDAAAACGDPLVTSVASFERALLRGERDETTVSWPCDPYAVLGALLQGDEIPNVSAAPHRTIVSSAIESLFRVERVT
ncbi:MAG TPA: DUF692 family protein [Thermoanaerobaculia bacterium]|nr:DUF692 family protein [Thermoanaerobaculia bacterium]